MMTRHAGIPRQNLHQSKYKAYLTRQGELIFSLPVPAFDHQSHLSSATRDIAFINERVVDRGAVSKNVPRTSILTHQALRAMMDVAKMLVNKESTILVTWAMSMVRV